MKEKISVKVLLVDDDARNLDVLESVLASPDIILVRAQTADEALLRLIGGRFAAILLDVQMPGVDGFELASLIKQRKQTRDIPIIFITAYYLEDKDILCGYQAGAVDYLVKPFNPLILKSKINVFVDLYRKNIELARANQDVERAEEAMKQANNKLEGRVQERTVELVLANRAKDDFLAMLSHELRTPLGPALLLASESADDPGIPEILRRRFHAIAKHVELEARLIDDLLDLTRIANGKLHLERRPVVVHSAIEDAVAIVEEEIKRKQIFIGLNLKAENCAIFGDPTRVRQIFWNIIRNAVKFTPAGGQITVETFSDAGNGRLSVKVTDTGIGLTAKEINSIFDAFSQGELSDLNGHHFGGLGLGLTIARRLVELQAGTIRAESPGRNQGATFTIEFPYLKTAENQIPVLPAPAAGPKTTKRSLSILVVEDDKLTQETLVQLLTRREHRVTAASSVTEARNLTCSGKFDVVLSDVGLPDGTGYTLMAELRDNFGLKGIALTGYGTGQDIENARKAGFITHLTKPIHINSLENALSQFH
ncbi:MAG TPA: response regulator [Candidatus Acidoferrales bacterium]|nr:response regulator [Candidatus Acidoferrales bacterium]